MFDAGLRHGCPGMNSPAAELADDGGEPVMTLAALRNAHAAGETLPEILARLGQAAPATIPPLTLVLTEAAGASGRAAA